MRPLALAAALVLSCIVASCGGGVDIGKLPETSPFASSSTYGIVVDAYASVKAAPDPTLTDGYLLRKGQIVEVMEARKSRSEADDEPVLWKRVRADGKEGWVLAKALREYEGMETAKKAAAELGK